MKIGKGSPWELTIWSYKRTLASGAPCETQKSYHLSVEQDAITHVLPRQRQKREAFYEENISVNRKPISCALHCQEISIYFLTCQENPISKGKLFSSQDGSTFCYSIQEVRVIDPGPQGPLFQSIILVAAQSNSRNRNQRIISWQWWNWV